MGNMTKMSDELKAAVERLDLLQQSQNYAIAYGASFKDCALLVAADRELLSDAYLALIYEQQRSAAERALPIDAEWLKSIGFFVWCGLYMVELENLRISIKDKPGWWDALVDGSRWPVKLHSRGQLLDLLAALKIEPKGTE